MQKQVVPLLPDQVRAVMDRPSETERGDVRQFVDWCAFYNLKMPAVAEDVGEYLFELLEHEYPLRDIKRIAKSIMAYYERRKYFLDRWVVRQAMKLIEAQLSPDRVLN